MRILAYQDQFFFTELFFVTTLKKEFQNKVSRKVVGRANKRVKRIDVGGARKENERGKEERKKKIEVGVKRSNRKKKLKGERRRNR
jgi:hypothetical protein